jgi:hypothetical protein
LFLFFSFSPTVTLLLSFFLSSPISLSLLRPFRPFLSFLTVFIFFLFFLLLFFLFVLFFPSSLAIHRLLLSPRFSSYLLSVILSAVFNTKVK